MRCLDFRLAAEDRVPGSASLSPRLRDHLHGCPSCQRWELERNRWGELGVYFREEACSADTLVLRSRVRTYLAAYRAPGHAWLAPAFRALAAGLAGAAALLLLVARAGGPLGVWSPFAACSPA